MQFNRFPQSLWFSMSVLFVLCLSPLSAASIIQVGTQDFKEVFKDRENWLQWEVELSAFPSKKYHNPENPNYFKNVEMKATLAYSNKSKSKKEQKYVIFESKVLLAMLEKQKKVKMYFYLPGDVIKYYNLSKRPEYYYLEFSVDGKAIKTPDKSYFSKGMTAELIEGLKKYAEKYAKKTDGMLQPIHLAPWYVTTKVDVTKLPSISRKQPRSGK